MHALAAAVLAGAAAALLPVAPASACYPDRFPYCTTYCKALLMPYDNIRQWVDPPLPEVPRTGVAGCP